MRYLIGVILFLVGSLLGVFGDYPFDGLMNQSPLLMIIGGVMCGLGLAVLILGGGGRGEGRGDEPPNYIAP